MEEIAPKRLAKFCANLWVRYRIRYDDFIGLLESQNHRCAICDIELKTGLSERAGENKPVVDHCHSAGHVRGILCHSCNKLIGLAKENTNTLHRAIVYLAQRSVL